MLVGVPPPVAVTVNVSPLSGGGPTLVVAATRPSLASAEPPIVRLLVVPVLRVILPPETEEGLAGAAPVAASIADNRCATVSPTPILVPALTDPATKVKVTPSTDRVSPVVIADDSESVLEAPDSAVAPVMAAGVLRLLLTA